MEEKNNITEVAPVSEAEFEEHLRNNINLKFLQCIVKFKSVKRAFKRGHITNYGYIVPYRPFNNRKHTEGRKDNIYKKKLYQNITGKKVMQ